MEFTVISEHKQILHLNSIDSDVKKLYTNGSIQVFWRAVESKSFDLKRKHTFTVLWNLKKQNVLSEIIR